MPLCSIVCAGFLQEDFSKNKSIYFTRRAGPSFVFKFFSADVSGVLADLINGSVISGVFPDCFKSARVIPLHKSGSKTDRKNYRPISTLPFCSKVYERCIHNRLVGYLDKYRVLFPDQYGFLRNRCTTDAVLKFTDCCAAALNKRQFLLATFLDFSKAFDTLDIDIMCCKLREYGFRGFMNTWFESYLRGRTQYVEVGQHKSSTVTLSCSVPQGSILGPLCFLLYVNDMHRCSSLNFVQFADDSTVYCSGPSLCDLSEYLNVELNKIDKWLCANKLSLNVVKSSYTIFSNKNCTNTPRIEIRGVP